MTQSRTSLLREQRQARRGVPLAPGKPRGLLATFETDRDGVRASVEQDIQRESVNGRRCNWARLFHRAWGIDEFMYVPLVGEPHHAAKIRRGDWEYLAKVLGLQRTRWFRDPKTGAIRAHKNSSHYASGRHSYDVVAALYCLKDGDSYSQADPLDLTNVQVHRH